MKRATLERIGDLLLQTFEKEEQKDPKRADSEVASPPRRQKKTPKAKTK
jgi:hypothetical protein